MRVQIPQRRTTFYDFSGGLDLTSPPIQIKPGALINCSNVEIGVNGGYLPIAGYERFSGKAKPSDSTYTFLPCTLSATVNLADVVTDQTAAAYGTVIAIIDGFLIITKVTGVFALGNIKVGASVVGVCTGAQSNPLADTQADDATYKSLAANVYRQDIAAVPGIGSILGVWIYNGKVYAFRNNAGMTAAIMHVSTGSGWTPVTMMRELVFTSGGTYEIKEGDIITGAISGATATVKRVCVRTGTFAAGSAAGSLIVNSQVGTFVSENLDIPAHANSATVAANSSAISLAPGGRFEFINWNFGGASGTKRMYACDGVSKAFEFDGEILVPITTAMASDTPRHIRQHKNHLFLSFGASVQFSSIGNPYSFSPVLGAAEIACGDSVTGFLNIAGSQASGALAIYTKNRTLILYGNDSTDFNLISFDEEAGAKEYTSQFIGQGVVLDDQGIMTLATTQNFGNFASSATSEKIRPLLDRLAANYSVIASCISRRKNQYRLFYSSGLGIYMTIKKGNVLGFTAIDLPQNLTCITSQEGITADEEIYFGASDGFVYQMDVGTSFDGNPIAWNAQLAFNHINSPRGLKSFHKAVLEITGNSYVEFYVSDSISYDSTEFERKPVQTSRINLSSASWDSSIWDQFYWDGKALSPSEIDITGTAENISLNFAGESDKYQPCTFHSAILHYTQRRLMR